MKLAQTTLSKLRRSDLFVENRSAQDSQLRRSGIFHFVSRADVAPTELENFLDAVATKIPRLRRWEMPQINSRGSVQGDVNVAPASWSAPVLWRFDHGGQKRQRAAAVQNLAEFGGVSLTPWLQPGVERPPGTTNRFNGLSRARKAVETAGDFLSAAVHRAKATVLMRGAE